MLAACDRRSLEGAAGEFFGPLLARLIRNCYGFRMVANLTTAMLTSLLLPALLLAGCATAPAGASDNRPQVYVQSENGRHTLIRDGEPYVILGAGGNEHLADLRAKGGNTIRTWAADNIDRLLDEAHKHGISVVVGIWIEHQRHGYDHSNPEHRARERARVEQAVTKYRDHPAVLAWGVGNEVEFDADLTIALEQIQSAAALIKSLDPDHPTMAILTEIGEDKAIRVQRECPDIDILGINTYGGMGSMPERLARQGFDMPYAITEFGPLGFWEVETTAWGAPYEQSSAAKARFIRQNYQHTIVDQLDKNCVGSFAFLWGAKQERTPTWFGLYLKSGEATQSVDVLEEFWSGRAPEQRAPIVTALRTDAGYRNVFELGETVTFEVLARDPNGDALEVDWLVKPESTAQSVGGDFEDAIDALHVSIRETSPLAAAITLPDVPGAYRVFAIVRDGTGRAGYVNMPVHAGPTE